MATQTLGGEAAHVALGAEDIMSQRMTFIGQLLELVEDKLGGRVAIGVDLFQHHVALLGDLGLGEGGVEKHVGEELEAPVEMLGERGGVEAGLLLGGEGVELAPHPVDAVQDMVRAAVFGAFEEGMLDEVGHPLVGTVLVAAADIYVDARPGHPRRDAAEHYADAVGQCVVFVHCSSCR